MRRYGRGRSRRAKRAVSWLAGVSTYDSAGGTSSRLMALTTTGLPAGVWGATTGLVVASDLPDHGGEDAVLTRVIGRLGFMDGRRDSGAGLASYGFQLRVVVAQVAAEPTGIFSQDFTTSAGMGNDNILYMRDVVVPGVPIGVSGGGYELAIGGYERWLDIDIKARRRVQNDYQIIAWYQTVLPGGTVSADFRMLGGLRSLLMRPR